MSNTDFQINNNCHKKNPQRQNVLRFTSQNDLKVFKKKRFYLKNGWSWSGGGNSTEETLKTYARNASLQRT